MADHHAPIPQTDAMPTGQDLQVPRLDQADKAYRPGKASQKKKRIVQVREP